MPLAYSSLRSMRISAARKTISARRGAGTSRHLAKARLAASTAASTSALFDRWKMPTTSRVSAGLRSSKVSPLADSTHSPSTKFLKTLAFVVPPSITGLVRISVAIGASWIAECFMLTTESERSKAAGSYRASHDCLHIRWFKESEDSVVEVQSTFGAPDKLDLEGPGRS